MPRRRLGVALLVPPPVATEVAGLRRALGDPSLARMPAHLTLVPPVNVRDDRLPEALAVLRRAAARGAPLGLVLGPPATFMPDSPVVHLAVGGSTEALAALQALRDQVFTDPLSRSLTWPFVPHVTLADTAPSERIQAAVAAMADYRVEVVFERVHLLEEGRGRVWAPIADAALAAPGVVGRGGLELELAASRLADPEAAALVEEGLGVVVVARRDGRVVGAASGRIEGAAGHLTELAVVPAERGGGVGSHLLAAFLARAAESGCARVTADAEPGSGAERFLHERGWVRAGEVVRLERRL